MTPRILRLSAFPFEGRGGNPAGIVLDATELGDADMLSVAKDVGYSETAFLFPGIQNRHRVRYFSPEMEVDFCGHATIAAAVALSEASGAGTYIFETNTGEVEVTVTGVSGAFQAELRSAIGQVTQLADDLLSQLLEIFGWSHDDLASEFTPMISHAGNSHPVLVLESQTTMATLDYNFEALQKLSRKNHWPTVQLIARETQGIWRSRNPFAFGGVYEDPATGSAAAAFGVYLRETGHAEVGDSFQIKQGFEMGQPCLLTVTIDPHGAKVSGGTLTIGR